MSSAKTLKIREEQIRIHNVYTGRHFVIKRRKIKKLSYISTSGLSYHIKDELKRLQGGSKTFNN